LPVRGKGHHLIQESTDRPRQRAGGLVRLDTGCHHRFDDWMIHLGVYKNFSAVRESIEIVHVAEPQDYELRVGLVVRVNQREPRAIGEIVHCDLNELGCRQFWPRASRIDPPRLAVRHHGALSTRKSNDCGVGNLCDCFMSVT
jgi:hypothetical protein